MSTTDDELRTRIAANLERLLDSRAMNQRQLAKATGETCMSISRVARGIYVPGGGILVRISEALGVTVDNLIAKPEKKKRKTS